MPLKSALRRERQEKLCEFWTDLVYKGYFQDSKTITQRNSVSKPNKQTKNKTIKQKSQDPKNSENVK